MKKNIGFIIVSVLLIFSCRTGNLSTRNYSYLYDKEILPYIPDCLALHKNDSVTTVFLKINSGNLLYTKEINEEIFSASCSFKAELYNYNDLNTLIDSSSFTIKDNDNSRKTDLTGCIDIKAKIHGTYLLKITFTDLNKHSSVESFLNIYKENRFSGQNFMMTNADSQPFYKPWISSDEEFRIVSENKKIEKLFVRYYHLNFPIATPPFSEPDEQYFNFNADSVFTVKVDNGKTALLKFPQKGIYHFQTDSSKKDGFTVFRFDDDFPKVVSVTQMLQSLRYLTTRHEFEDLLTQKNKKDAIDNFWIETAGNTDRAKNLIKMYYNRVQDANLFFTSYLEGWKTDRGIIYIVYGTPNLIYRGKNVESWVYGEVKSMLSITFTFSKVENPFSDNDYILARSPLYKDGWYIEVQNWRR